MQTWTVILWEYNLGLRQFTRVLIGLECSEGGHSASRTSRIHECLVFLKGVISMEFPESKLQRGQVDPPVTAQLVP